MSWRVFVHLDANQGVCLTAKVAVGIGENALIFVKSLHVIRIATKVKRDELFSRYMAGRMIWGADQIFHPTPGHADFQLGEFAVRRGIAGGLSRYGTILRLRLLIITGRTWR